MTAEKLDFKRVFPIFMIVLVDLLGLTIIIPLLPLYAASFGADPLTIGVIAAAYPTMQLIGGPLLGSLSDRYGRKPVLLVSQIGTLIGFLLLGFANALPILLLSRVIDGLSGANIVAAQAAITDVTTPQTRTQGLGLIGAAFGLGFTLGPAIAGIALALSNNNYQVPAFIAAGFSLVTILLTAFRFDETHPAERRAQHAASARTPMLQTLLRAIRSPFVGMLLVLMFAQQLVFGGFENLASLFNLSRLGLNASSNAVVFVYIGILVVFVQGYAIGRWSQRFGERRLVLAGLLLLGVSLMLIAVTPEQPVPWYSRAALVEELSASTTSTVAVALPSDANTGWLGLGWLLLMMIPASIGGAILSPSINSLITKRAAPQETGAILGVSASMVSLANAITPLIGGALFQWLGSTAPFLFGGLVMLALLALSIVLKTGVETAAQPG
ncbi:MAG: MFS transporter [Anaerolineae bacterium]|nr:MFS transporter [Anaerolineae bacterium]